MSSTRIEMEELEHRLAGFLARQRYLFSWSKMTRGERNESVQFEMWQPSFKPLLEFINREVKEYADR